MRRNARHEDGGYRVDRQLYRVLIVIIKYYPFVLSWLYLAGSLMTCCEVNTKYMVLLCKVSFLSLVILIITSHCLDFCTRHRMPLYYVFGCNVVDALHEYVGGAERVYMWVYAGMFVFLYVAILIDYAAHH